MTADVLNKGPFRGVQRTLNIIPCNIHTVARRGISRSRYATVGLMMTDG
jgi:hypothetical protein